MAEYMILLRNEAIDFKSFAPEDYQKLVKDFEQWTRQLVHDRKLIASANLKDGEGTTLRQKGESVLMDGPYCETKEAVAGFFLVEAGDVEQAVAMAKGCPFLPLGGSVEVRPAHFDLEDNRPTSAKSK